MTGLVQRRADSASRCRRSWASACAAGPCSGFARRAKYIECFLDDGTVLLLHLGMSGRLVFDGEPCGPHEHLTFAFDDGTILRFVDPRRFGMLDLWPAATLAEHRWLAHLGLEPLDAGFNGRGPAPALAGRRTALKVALMDQRLVVGVGNIYASESLFRARLDPARAAGSLGAREARRLARSVRAVLLEAIEAGGSSLRDYVQSNGELGNFQRSFRVYDRAGEPCTVCAQTGRAARPGCPRDLLVPHLPALSCVARWGWTGRGRVVFNLLRCGSRLVRRSAAWPRAAGVQRSPIDALRDHPGRAARRVGLVTLNRPKALNALNAQVIGEIEAALSDFDADDEIVGHGHHRLGQGLRRRRRHQGDAREGLRRRPSPPTSSRPGRRSPSTRSR